ncbi:PREDICTED: uncharacterized protein LOC109236747 [Nicotiana attenuata]|uniref:Mitochondrial protein n=1 Tax=Nicotiana attenuata TaxID=49451 RepID=A0A1J6JBJ9_NICAT|nr:PREDICTED: uncharacterized protein LOC109236747 [Nicotiana attenuata]OIT08211.1 putative mitochondrial protein [Nicotiana attenuata]
MRQPTGFESTLHPTHVCKLNKAIYVPKQSPRVWYNELKNHLLALGFIKYEFDASLFILYKSGVTVYIIVYVDDIIVNGNQPQTVKSTIDALSSRFSLKDLGLLHYFLGVEVTQTADGLLISQHKYIKDLLQDVNMAECKGVLTPITSTCTFETSHEDSKVDGTLYRRVIGKLHYMFFTRPDIAFAISKLSQFMHQPGVSHWKVVKRLLRYLCHTSHIGIKLAKKSTAQLVAYSDSDWASDPLDRTSITGYIVYLGDSFIMYLLPC